MLELFIANKNYSSWSLRPWLLMRELGLPFRETLVPFGAGSPDDPDAFHRFSPSGKVPCLVDGDLVVWDSLAICEYLGEKHAGVWPSDGAARTWSRCAAAEMHAGFPTLRNVCTMNCGLRVQIDPFPEPLLRDWRRIAELWSEGCALFGGPYLGGSTFSAVDAFYAPVAFRVQTYRPPLPDAARAYVDRLLSLPSMQAWYEAALAETWRDEEHEDEARQAGAWLQDLRRVAC